MMSHHVRGVYHPPLRKRIVDKTTMAAVFVRQTPAAALHFLRDLLSISSYFVLFAKAEPLDM